MYMHQWLSSKYKYDTPIYIPPTLICCQPNEQVLTYISQRWFNHSISKMIYFYQL